MPPGADRTLIILGASYAEGWGEPALPGFQRVLNRGAGGERTDQYLARFEAEVLALEPDAVLIWGHVNNITQAPEEGREAAKASAREDYRAMLRLARAAGVEVMFATEVPWTEDAGWLAGIRGWIGTLRGKRSYASRITGHVRELNGFLRVLAAREGCRLLDFDRAFAGEDGLRRPEYGADDGSHITPAGYRALTDYAVRALARAR